MYFLHRYVRWQTSPSPRATFARLSGIYAIVLALHATLLKLLATGIQVAVQQTCITMSLQSHLVRSRVEMCRDTWWANLLYINNFTGLRCLGQTWCHQWRSPVTLPPGTSPQTCSSSSPRQS